MIFGTQEEAVTRMKCVLLIRHNVLIIHREIGLWLSHQGNQRMSVVTVALLGNSAAV